LDFELAGAAGAARIVGILRLSAPLEVFGVQAKQEAVEV
jgi:hypothetical protein